MKRSTAVSRLKERLALVRLLQLASPALPVGGYSYSQGLEWAIDAGIVRDAASAELWISDALRYPLARFEAPLWLRLYLAWQKGDTETAKRWNRLFLAARETAELRAETIQMGYSLRRLLNELGEFSQAQLDPLNELDSPAFPAAFSFAAAAWGIPAREGLTAYVWSWLENQVMAAVKAVPLGQTDGQRMLLSLANRIPVVVSQAIAMRDEDIGSFAPGFAILSSKHETQYSRLFRS